MQNPPPSPRTLAALITALRAPLAPLSARGDDPARTARRLIAHLTGLDVAAQLGAPEIPITAEHAATAHALAARIAAGEPLTRALGARDFYGLTFALSPATLDPRPETELIVTAVLQYLKEHNISDPPKGDGPNFPLPLLRGGRGGGHIDPPLTLLDLGTGTGCIPISILKYAPHLTAVAVDINPQAIETSRQNALTHGVENRITFIESDWFAALPPGQRFDLITSNPPYIRASDIPTLDDSVKKYDPILALAGGETGLEAYEKIFSGLEKVLKSSGMAWFEIGQGQAEEIARLAAKYGLDVCPPILDDADIPRVIGVKKRLKNNCDSGA